MGAGDKREIFGTKIFTQRFMDCYLFVYKSPALGQAKARIPRRTRNSVDLMPSLGSTWLRGVRYAYNGWTGKSCDSAMILESEPMGGHVFPGRRQAHHHRSRVATRSFVMIPCSQKGQ